MRAGFWCRVPSKLAAVAFAVGPLVAFGDPSPFAPPLPRVTVSLPITAPSGCESLPGPIDDGDRIDAMLTVHAWSRWPDGGFPNDVMPLPLGRAMRILACDTDRLAPSRRRRALAKLAAFGLRRPRVRAAIEQLGADPAAIERALATDGIESFGRGTTGTGSATTRAETARADPALVQGYVADLFRTSLRVLGCDWSELYARPSDDGLTASAHVGIMVARSVDELAVALDPQRWDECSKFWKPPERAYFAVEGDDGKAKKSREGIVQATTLPFGHPFPSSLLYEHFSCDSSICRVDFEMILRTKAQRGERPCGDEYFMDYSKDETVSGMVVDVETTVDVDDGWVSACRGSASEKATVEGFKRVKFGDPVINGFGVFAIQHAELAEELAELACCSPPQ